MKNPFKLIFDKLQKFRSKAISGFKTRAYLSSFGKTRKRESEAFFAKFNIEPVKPDVEIMGYTLVRTCYACPEQYDVLTKHGMLVGYLRLRHGHFTAQYPDVYGKLIYEASPIGDGLFESHERLDYLMKAVEAIDKARELPNPQ